MKVINVRNFMIFALAALAGTALLHTSQRVQQAEERLAVIRADIDKERDMTRVLNAEWEYLNRPERLEKLATEYLELVPPSPDNMRGSLTGEPASLPDKAVPEFDPMEAQPVTYTGDEETGYGGVPLPKMKPAVMRAPEAPTPPPPAPEAPVAKEPPKEKNAKNFDALLNELNTGAGE